MKNDPKKKTLVIRLLVLLFVLLIAASMFVIGRGHTVYFDNKTLEAAGQTFESIYSVEVLVDGERVAKLRDNERGMTTTMGQKFAMELSVKNEKGADPSRVKVTLSLPYNMDGIIINIPAMLKGQGSDVYMSEFIPTPSEEELEEEEVVTDETEGLMDFGESEDSEGAD